LTLDALLAALADSGTPDRRPPAPLDPPPPVGDSEPGQPMDAGDVHGVLAGLLPEDAIIVLESPSSTLALRNRLRISRPGSYYFGSAGGLGFGLAAALGVQLAQPGRPVVCVLGEGSAQYAITGFWTAKAYNIPVTFLVLRNSEYAILKWFATLEQIEGAPGLDLPALDVAATAASYGVPSRTVTGRDELHAALGEALAAQDGPRLVEVGVRPGMALQ
ncbi:MAG: benzoylformate decarboxylase, partial [Baekduia sp.]|nr:benzoylformate decarboxylase [Baekduia sp.]